PQVAATHVTRTLQPWAADRKQAPLYREQRAKSYGRLDQGSAAPLRPLSATDLHLSEPFGKSGRK
ncbi:MAG: hypothetical protein AAF961_12065, partial [Planctomycetota bacterium]